MGSINILKRCESKASAAEKIIAVLKSEVDGLLGRGHNGAFVIQTDSLVLQNRLLRSEIERYKNELVRLQNIRGAYQVSLASSCTPKILVPNSAHDTSKDRPDVVHAPVAKLETKSQNKCTMNRNTSLDAQESLIHIGRLDLRVGKIVNAKKHPQADSLYVEEVDVGEGKNLTVVSGLVKHIDVDELKNRMVVLLCNLKPVKMRGVISEGMVMCASSLDKVEILTPPTNCIPGDLVHVEGYPRKPDFILNPKKKIFETCAPHLTTDDQKQAVYKGIPFYVPGKGAVVAPTLSRAQVK